MRHPIHRSVQFHSILSLFDIVIVLLLNQTPTARRPTNSNYITDSTDSTESAESAEPPEPDTPRFPQKLSNFIYPPQWHNGTIAPQSRLFFLNSSPHPSTKHQAQRPSSFIIANHFGFRFALRTRVIEFFSHFIFENFKKSFLVDAWPLIVHVDILWQQRMWM